MLFVLFKRTNTQSVAGRRRQSYLYPEEVACEQRMRGVAGRQFCNRLRPANVHPGVIRIQATFSPRLIRSGMEIQHFAVFGQGLEAVSKALGDHQGFVVAGTQDFRVPAQEGGRALTQVHGDIEYLAEQATHELNLGVGWVLKVHAAYRALPGCQCVVDLHNGFAGDQRL
jgi:hypothetical protein